ncbi:MAG: crotonobetainyl-CoA--carnitine CoA-transferase [Phycisphaerae bacterium]|nr:crotonobetainyl-CoA--carnitine CoA-transferase [Phycisphaerae bacterium]
MRKKFLSYFKNCPIPDEEILSNLGLFLNRQTLSRMLFMHELYKQIINVHGIIVEFGVRWGQNQALFSSFRGMYEPYNYNRKIVGFDTFSGYPEVSDEDGNNEFIKKGAYSVTENYEEYLEVILDYHEKESPISHIKKHELVKGDATVEIKRYLDENPETIIALAYFDFDIYPPTKKCLEAIIEGGHVTKGSVIGFDELNCHEFPGETRALREVLGLDKYKIRRDVSNPLTSYIVIE